ncbi:hypothetical protein BO94DRAFT_468872, partial [Aspergillus sclerotioniger CBS 115572]
VEPRNRVEFLTMFSSSWFLKGASIPSMTVKFKYNITVRLEFLDIIYNWCYWRDFATSFYTELTTAAIDSFYGLFLVFSCLSFTENLWTLDRNIQSLLVSLPRPFTLTVYTVCDYLLTTVKYWHVWAQDAFYLEFVNQDGDNLYWGTAFFREW